MSVFLIIVFIIYFLFLILLMMGWGRYSNDSLTRHHFHFLSVVIPFRNEANNLPTLIDTLRKLDYPKDRLEILLIDDHSTDDSLCVAEKLASNFSNVKILSANSTGKKLAITQGVDASQGEIIITTDADCELQVDWLKSINKQFQDPSIKMLVGAVRIKPDVTFFSKLQATEFSSLMGSAAATLNLGFPTMCNGANLSYRKKTFEEVNGFEGNVHIPSGDDEFLMRKVMEKFGAKSLKFLMDLNAVVTTNPQSSLKDFFAQRFRWAGKWSHNSNKITKALAVFILVFQLSWVAALGALFFQDRNSTILFLIAVKVMMEGYFLFMISTFMRQRFSLNSFLLLQIIYPFYVITVGVFSNVIRVQWKERSIPN